MNTLYNTEINVYFENDDDIQVNESLNGMFEISQKMEKLLEKRKTWFFSGHSKKDALENIAFDDNGPTKNAIAIVSKHYKKNKPLINESFWDGEQYGESCSISHYMMFILNPKKGMFVIGMDEKMENTEKMISMVMFLARTRNKAYVAVDSKGYKLNKYNVFPDRIYVGWMLYIPHVVLPNLVPQAAKVIPVMDGDKQKGTIVISTEDIFDGSNKEHIAKANDLEIRLLDLGLLPLMTEL